MTTEVDISAFADLDESMVKVFQDPAVQERLARFAESQKTPVLNKNKEVLGKYSDLQKQINDLGGFESLKSLAQQAAESKALADAAAAKSSDVETVRKQAQSEIEKRDVRIAAMEQRELSAKTSSAVSKAIAAADGVPELLEPHVRARVKSTLGEDGKISLVVLNADGSEMLVDGVKPATVKDLLADLKANPTFQPAFKTVTSTGSGAKGGDASIQGMANPFLAATRSLTKQNEIARSDPALAKVLAAAAGITLNL